MQYPRGRLQSDDFKNRSVEPSTERETQIGRVLPVCTPDDGVLCEPELDQRGGDLQRRDAGVAKLECVTNPHPRFGQQRLAFSGASEVGGV